MIYSTRRFDDDANNAKEDSGMFDHDSTSLEVLSRLIPVALVQLPCVRSGSFCASDVLLRALRPQNLDLLFRRQLSAKL